MNYLALRMLSSFLVGLILSQTGSLLQLGTRNILSSPSTLGFDGLSVLWFLISYSLFLGLGIGVTPIVGVPIFILAGWFVARIMTGQHRYEKVILLGISFNLLIGALFSLWQFFFLAFNLPFPSELWFGHFRHVEMPALIWLIAIELYIGLGLFVRFRDLQLFSLGRDIAENWGLNELRLFRFIFISVAVGTFIVVSLFGAFSFLGLIFPIIARKIWFKKYDLEGEFLFGAILNGMFLMLMDAICYFMPIYGAEIPVGLIVSAIGAVSLILLLWINNKHSEIVANPKK